MAISIYNSGEGYSLQLELLQVPIYKYPYTPIGGYSLHQRY